MDADRGNTAFDVAAAHERGRKVYQIDMRQCSRLLKYLS